MRRSEREICCVQIILDAAEDGSSVMCKACGALVRTDRKRAHDRMWCSAIPDEEDEADLEPESGP